jgi:hypothetical protein
MRRLITALAIVALCSAACGKSEEQKKAEEAAENIKKAAEALTQAAEKQGTAAGANDMAKAMQGMAAALGGKTADGKAVEPVAFQTLQIALPEVSGWEMGKPKGERMSMPMAFSQSEATYRNGQERVRLSIIDTALASMVLGPYRMMAAVGYSRETSDGYEKATTFNGHGAVEKWQPERKRGEFTVILDDRFVVDLHGSNISGIKTLHDFAGKVDFAKVRAMK